MDISRFTHLIAALFLAAACTLVADNDDTVEPIVEAGDSVSKGCHIIIDVEGFKGGSCKFLGIFGKQNYLALPAFEATGERIIIENDERFETGLYYLLLPEKKNIKILLDKNQHFSMSSKVNDIVNTMVTDSEENQLYYQNRKYESEYNRTLRQLRKKIEKLEEDDPNVAELKAQINVLIQQRHDHIAAFAENHPDAFFTRFKLAGQNPELTYPLLPDGEIDKEKQLAVYKAHYWDHVDFTSADMLRTPVFHNKLDTYIKKLTTQRIDDVIAAADEIVAKVIQNEDLFKYVVSYVCLAYRKPKFMGGEAIFVHMVQRYLSKKYEDRFDAEEVRKARALMKRLRPSLLGKIGRNIRARNDQGEYVALYDLEAPIKILYIYNVDCSHCQEETPKLKALYDEWKDRGVDVYAMCMNEDKESWKAYIEEEQLSWHNVIDPKFESGYYAHYHIDITPEIYVLNEEHKIICKDLKAYQLPPIFKRELARISGDAVMPASDAVDAGEAPSALSEVDADAPVPDSDMDEN